MANKRMFSNAVIDNDVFLDMPLSTQALYFHLGMKADDDGFVGSPKKIVRSVSCTEDDLKLLIAKGFVISFESGIIVIRHWNENNTIRKERKKETLFQNEKQKLLLDKNNVYSINERFDNQLSPTCHPNGDQTSAQYSIVEYSRVENNTDTLSAPADARTHFDYQAVVDAFNSVCVSLPKVKKLTDRRRKAIKKALPLLDDLSFENYFAIVEQSDFLTGRSGGNDWRADFDWILEEKHFCKIVEGCYGSESGESSTCTQPNGKRQVLE